jgi:hypothetical protein
MPRTTENISPTLKKRIGLLRLSGKPSHVISSQLGISVETVWQILTESESFPSREAVEHASKSIGTFPVASPAKLTPNQVREIKKRRRAGDKCKDIAPTLGFANRSFLKS